MKYLLIIGILLITISFIPDTKRYFYVVYSATNNQKGCFTLVYKAYPTLDSLYIIANRQTDHKTDYVVIDNIVELSKTDFLHFTKSH